MQHSHSDGESTQQVNEKTEQAPFRPRFSPVISIHPLVHQYYELKLKIERVRANIRVKLVQYLQLLQKEQPNLRHSNLQTIIGCHEFFDYENVKLCLNADKGIRYSFDVMVTNKSLQFMVNHAIALRKQEDEITAQLYSH
jgi:hypothetical protein